jgi:hypothetical protein
MCWVIRGRVSAGGNRAISEATKLHVLQVCIRRWVAEDPQHRDNLAFVVKCVGYHVQQDKPRTPEFATPIHGALSNCRVESFLREISYIGSRRFSYAVFSRL